MKKTILITAYAVNPFKGSEDAIGWNIIYNLASHCNVLAITRRNNQADIEKFLAHHPTPCGQNLFFEYFDPPRWATCWKRGGRGALLYHYLWHLGVAFFILRKKWHYDLAHHLNFNSDWSPSFLWLLNKPYIWGPVGHHPRIPAPFLRPYGKKAMRSDRFRWLVKCFFWKLDPWLYTSKRTATKVIGLNSSVGKVLRLPAGSIITIPAIASELPDYKQINSDKFQILSIGRFVPLKGFDVTIRAFSQFYKNQPTKLQGQLELVLIGKGPERERLEGMVVKSGLPSKAVRFVDWVPRDALPQFFASSKAFLFPSHEGGGMVVAEAMGYGLPVLCFDNEGPGENVDETCGVKIPYSLGYEGAITAFAEAMGRLLYDEAWRLKLSEGAREYFEAHFTWVKKAKIIDEIYEEALNPSKVLNGTFKKFEPI